MDYKKYSVYIVGSQTGTLYIGMTNNLYRRVLVHKSGGLEGFASKYGCNRLVYCESFDDVRNAIDREQQLKGWRREKKIALIEALNPRWQDLAREMGSSSGIFGGIDREQMIRCHPERSVCFAKQSRCGVEGPRVSADQDECREAFSQGGQVKIPCDDIASPQNHRVLRLRARSLCERPLRSE